MWAIRLMDGRPGILYLREYLLDGRILVFEKEELMLRFLASIRDSLQRALNVRPVPIRYSDDPRKDKPRKVSEAGVPALIQTVCDCLK